MCSNLQLSQHHDVVVRVSWSGVYEIQKNHPFLIEKQCTSPHLLRAVSEIFIPWGIHISPLYGLLFSVQLVVLAPHLATSNVVIQETGTFSPTLVQ